MELNKIYNQDCLEGLKSLADNSIDCCVTSPPYFGLRDYGTDAQIGLEATPELFISKLVEVFTEVRRVLKPEGTLWLNLGDSYASSGKNRTEAQAIAKSGLNGGLDAQTQILKQQSKITGDLKAKDLIGIPWMAAFALRSSGWYLRQDIIWNKPACLLESVQDRCTKSHEYIFLLSKSNKYYYDNEAIKEPIAESTVLRMAQDVDNQKGSNRQPGKANGNMKCVGGKSQLRNKRSVWTVPTARFSEAHFATFPEDLIVDMIKAGCPETGTVLDPFIGAGTTALVASKLNRNYIGFELNPEYIKIAEKRIYDQIGLFKIA